MTRAQQPGIRGYVGAHLHRRLFVWFGLAILATGATVFLTMDLLGSHASRGWTAERERISRFVSGRFARVWDDPVERTELARSMARDLDVAVRLQDATGTILANVGYRGHCRWSWHVPVASALGHVGTAQVCADRHRHGAPLRTLVLTLAAAGLVLWAIAGRVSRRIARPLAHLTRVTDEIGQGNLSSRTALDQWHRSDELGALGASVNHMAERIERQLRDQRELLASVSHELRTPLTRIRLLLGLAEGGTVDATLLRDLDNEVVEMDTLVGELLANARVDFHALAPHRLDAGDVARRAVERAGLPSTSADVHEASGEVIADATLLARALAALLDNASKYGAPPVVVRVRPSDDGRSVSFHVEDRGRGFPPGDEERLMTAFARGTDTTTEHAPGVGLGLSLVRKIAEAHGGRCYARNRVEGGACVVIELPRELRARHAATGARA